MLGGVDKAHRPSETSRLLTLGEASETFGVDHKTIYRLHELGLIEALQRDGKGRVFYSEKQLRRALVTGAYSLVAA